tara:strand:+ start:7151 stop:7864 length:714 start_codon:yes stop_codon:yes gene_type:complete
MEMMNLIQLQIPMEFTSGDVGMNDLYMFNYECQFGKYVLKSLITKNKTLVQNISDFCDSLGYYDKWKVKTNYIEMTKIPMAFLVKLILYQKQNTIQKMIGAWSIGISKFSADLNVITSCDGKFIDKFSLTYGKRIYKTKNYEYSIEEGISFRTGVFNASNINQARQMLMLIGKYDEIIVDLRKDAFYFTNHSENKKGFIDNFIKKIMKDKSELLRKSYKGTNETVLEEEWKLIKNCL